MKYICNGCDNVFEADDMTIHHVVGDKGLEILSICPVCLDFYLKKIKDDKDRKAESVERMRMKRKW
jgi:hypothetical protein